MLESTKYCSARHGVQLRPENNDGCPRRNGLRLAQLPDDAAIAMPRDKSPKATRALIGRRGP
jgi:hypothetical protein